MEASFLRQFGDDFVSYDDPAWEEWDEKAENHRETKERGYTTRREEQEKLIVADNPSGIHMPEPTPEPSPKKRTVKSKIKSAIRKMRSDQPSPKKPSPTKTIVVNEPSPTKRTVKSKIRSKINKMRSEHPVVPEVVDVELEAARKKGYDAHMKDKRAREVKKAEKKGRRDAMTFKSKVVEDVGTVADKLEPVGERVTKNVGKLLGEAKYTAKAAARAPARVPARIATTTKTTTAKPPAQKKAKPGPAVRKGTLGRRPGGLPVKENRDGPGVHSKHGPGRRVEALGVHSKHGPENKPKGGPVANTKKGAPVNNIPKTATVNKQRSVNFAMRARSKK